MEIIETLRWSAEGLNKLAKELKAMWYADTINEIIDDQALEDELKILRTKLVAANYKLPFANTAKWLRSQKAEMKLTIESQHLN